MLGPKDLTMIKSLRERATARTRSGDVSPNPLPLLSFKGRVVRRVSRRPGRGAGPRSRSET